MIGTALAAIGFVVATVAPAAGATGIVDPANMVIGLGITIGVTPGAFLMGIGLWRTGAMSRFVAGLLVLVLPMTLLAGPVGDALGIGPMIGLLMVVPLVAAVIGIGLFLGTEPVDAAKPTPPPA